MIEEKIYVNEKINRNLEDQLNLLYHQMLDECTDFVELGDVIETTSGGTPSRKKGGFYEGGIHY